jgi:hypothetical protein
MNTPFLAFHYFRVFHLFCDYLKHKYGKAYE